MISRTSSSVENYGDKGEFEEDGFEKCYNISLAKNDAEKLLYIIILGLRRRR